MGRAHTRWLLSIAAALAASLTLAMVVLWWWPTAPPIIDPLRIGYAVEAPYAFLAPNGEVTGESPEIARRIAAELGIPRLEWVQTTFDSLLPDLATNRFDVVAAGMFITAERAKRVTFSRPSFHATHALLVRRQNPRDLHSYEDAVRGDDVRIAVIAGAVEERLLLRLGLPRHRLIAVPDALTGKSAVVGGVADGLALSSPAIRWMAALDSSAVTEIATPFRQTREAQAMRLGYGAFAFRPHDEKLVAAWNNAMSRFIGSAEHLDIVAHFGFTRDEIDRLPSVEDILRR